MEKGKSDTHRVNIFIIITLKLIRLFVDPMNKLKKILVDLPRHKAENYFAKNTRCEYLGNDTMLCRILGNEKIFAIGSDAGLTPHLIFEGYWEFWLTLHFARMIKPGDTVIDVGANLGYYTLLAANLTGPEGHVLGIEPNPHVHDLLQKTIRVNGYSPYTRADNIAISSSPSGTKLPFFVPKDEPKNGRIIGEKENVDYLRKRGSVFEVACGELDVEQFSKVDFIKIDVEGAELQVLDHLRPIIEKFSPHIICEVNFHRGYSYEDVQDVLGTKEILNFLDYDGQIKPLTKESAQNERIGDDWLVCYG